MAKNVNQPSKSSPHKIALYVRVSTEEQAENPEGSIRNQEERLRATVNLKNMEGAFGDIVAVFIDRARSGKDTNRPELQRLLAAIRRHEIDLVMVSELSRLSRSIKDFSEIWELMRANGCGFHSLRENFDTTTAAGEMVLYTVANIAQFERRQVSERVSANFQARAARGLYNGGVLPLGYRLIPEKPGFLEIDPEPAETVRMAFHAFLREGTLSTAAKWLNANGHKVKRETQGGNHRPRIGHFTVDNLHWILTNKSYLGVRRYKVRGETKETKAAWPAIIEEQIFNQVQAQLKANHRRKKPESESRYPYQLTGILECANCKEGLVGKSAHGNSGKVPYYEHGWSTKKQGCLLKPVFDCKPFRLPARKLEPALWEKVHDLLTQPKMAEELIGIANRIHKERTQNSESKRLQEKIRSLGGQLEVLAGRLAQLPKTVSAAPIFKQMERIEAAKAEEEKRLNEIQRNEPMRDIPVSLKTYQSFLTGLADLAQDPTAPKGKIIKALVHKVEITPEGFRAHFYVGRDYIEGELARRSAPRLLRLEPKYPNHGAESKIPCQSSQSLTHAEPGRRERGKGLAMDGQAFGMTDRGLKLLFDGSNTLTNGGPSKNRTCNKALGKLRYIHLTMGPFQKVYGIRSEKAISPWSRPALPRGALDSSASPFESAPATRLLL